MSLDYSGKRITVMGLGRFGGGSGVTRWLVNQGADVLVTDMQPPNKLKEPLADIEDLVQSEQVALRLGEHNVADFTTCDLVVANPAVPKPWENRLLRSATAAGVPITTEIRLLTERIDRAHAIGVTGSAGKSTTAAMIHHILVKAGFRAHLGGNIGGSLLNSLHQIQIHDWVVLELSSAMLYWLDQGVGFPDSQGWSPHVAVLTNINPNHIDWHDSFAHYQSSKLNIFKYQQPGDHRVDASILPDASKPIALKIPGAHNQFNARMAVAAAQRAAPIVSAAAALSLVDFPGLPHRLQLVAERAGMRFYNDSKSTTPEATVLAVAAFDNAAEIHLIAGGYDKGSDLAPIAALTPRIAGLYTIGATGKGLVDAAGGSGFAEYCQTLEQAIERAFERMSGSDVLLLSPGCASWDQFINYEQRGDQFTRLVRAHRMKIGATDEHG